MPPGIRASSTRASWWLTFVLVGALGSCWALASPPYSAVDEPLHVIKAVSIARGQWVGDALPESEIPEGTPYRNGWVTFDVPSVYGEAEESSRCFRGGEHVTEPANCFSFSGSSDTAAVTSLDPRYPPAYYLAVGLPARLVPDGPNAVRAMRLVSVAVVAALVASAVTSLRRLRRPALALVGLLVALTPMVFHLGSSVNPNGVEIGAAIALWASGLVLVREAPAAVDARVVSRVATAAVVLVLSRPASPVFAFLVLAVLAALAGRRGLRSMLRSTAVRVAGAAVAAAALFQVGWNQLVDPNYFGVPIPDVVPRTAVLRFAFSKNIGYYQQTIGNFGAPDFLVNNLTILLWTGLLGGLVALALAGAPRRYLLAIGAVVAMAVVIPVAADLSQADRFTYAWQGRYTMPLALGVPLLAGVGAALGPLAGPLARRRVLALVAAAFCVGQLLAFAEVLQRYTVGRGGPLLFLSGTPWTPPVPAALLLVVATATVVGLAAVPFVWGGERRELPEELGLGQSAPGPEAGPVEQDARSEA